MKGRKPTAQPAASAAAQPSPECPAPPVWLTASAKEEWGRVAPLLQARGHLTPDTMALFESYCMAAGLAKDCYTGKDERTPSLNLCDDPEPMTAGQSKLFFNAMREVRLLAGELGLTPTRRPADADAPPSPDNPWGADL